MQLGLRNVEQEVEMPVVVGEAGAGAVNEYFVAMYNVLGLCSIRVLCSS